MASIQRHELTERLVKGLKLRDRSPTPELSEIMQPVVLVEDLSRPTPLNPSSGRKSCSGSIEIIASAGNTAKVGLRNPPASKILLVPKMVVFGLNVSGRVLVGYSEATLGTLAVQVKGFNDTRLAGLPVGQLYQEDSITTPFGDFRFATGYAVGSAFNILPLDGIVIRETGSIIVEGTTTGGTVRATFHWEEWATTS